MTGRDKRGRFTRRNPYASMGGKARAERLTSERRREIAAQGFQAFVTTRFDGDKQRAVDWLGKLGAWASDAPYRGRFDVFDYPGSCPGGGATMGP